MFGNYTLIKLIREHSSVPASLEKKKSDDLSTPSPNGENQLEQFLLTGAPQSSRLLHVSLTLRMKVSFVLNQVQLLTAQKPILERGKCW